MRAFPDLDPICMAATALFSSPFFCFALVRYPQYPLPFTRIFSPSILDRLFFRLFFSTRLSTRRASPPAGDSPTRRYVVLEPNADAVKRFMVRKEKEYPNVEVKVVESESLCDGSVKDCFGRWIGFAPRADCFCICLPFLRLCATNLAPNSCGSFKTLRPTFVLFPFLATLTRALVASLPLDGRHSHH